MNFEQIIGDLKNKIYKPIYFLSGDEPYFIDLITKNIQENALSESEKAFNLTIIYGKDTEISTVINSAKRYPMMANYQVVIVKEAQNIKDIEDLIHYATNPLKSTILVINYKYKTLDKRKKLYKVINDNGILFESKKLYDNEIPGWINAYLKKRNHTIEPSAGMLMTEYLGNDLSKVANELEKLIITLPTGEYNITSTHIEKNIGISKDYNNFELHKALTQKNVLKANRIVNYFANNPKDNPIVLTISMLYHFFSKVLVYHFIKNKTNKQEVAAALKINPYFIADYEKAAKQYNPRKVVEIIALLREYDLRAKGLNSENTPDGELLKELVYKILH
ncbi:MAG: DNA polymerase III subunit delta [Bacteroidetes bacterium GWF2_33_16]|nr:MAG: DNA polymerase III subunit delta [Bacteroidetes bacterium GWE2_32_14]OFY08700.1 MAG: DNA polymerase III subunit delta [Bacteroidetes bacterium GWF2_33_16]